MSVEIGSIYEGKVTGITKFGAFVDVVNGDEKFTGMVHISEVSNGFVKEVSDVLKMGDTVKVKVMKIGDDGKIGMSIKKALPQPERKFNNQRNKFDRKDKDSDSDKPKHSSPRQKPKKEDKPSDEVVYSDGFVQKISNDASFEDMLSKFKSSSEEKISNLKKANDTRRRGGKRR